MASGGLTTQQREFPLQGIWQGGSRIYLDLVIIMTVLDFRRQGSTRFIGELKGDVLHAFDQLEILITWPMARDHFSHVCLQLRGEVLSGCVTSRRASRFARLSSPRCRCAISPVTITGLI